MLTANEIRAMQFQKSGKNAYKQVEVDTYLREVADNVDKLYADNEIMNKKIADLSQKIEEYKKDESAIQATLLSAQRLAEQIVSEAKANAENMVQTAKKEAYESTNGANFKAETIERESAQKAAELTAKAEKSAKQMAENVERETRLQIEEAEKKAEAMVLAAMDSVGQQQKYFDDLKIQVAIFRRDILSRYHSHIDFIEQIPDEILNSPEVASEKGALEVEHEMELIRKAGGSVQQTGKVDEKTEMNLPVEAESPVLPIEAEKVTEEIAEEITEPQGSVEETAPEQVQTEPEQKQSGFHVNLAFDEEETEKPEQAKLSFNGNVEGEEPVTASVSENNADKAIRKSGFKVMVDDEEEKNDDESAGFGFFGNKRK